MDYVDSVLGQTVTIRYKPDRSVPQRCMNQAIGKLWTPVHDAIVAAGKWQQGMKLGSTGRNGDLFLTDGEQILKLFKVELLPGYMVNITPVDANLHKFGITEDQATAFIAQSREHVATKFGH